MTDEEMLEMWEEKKAFIESISKIFESRPRGASIANIGYEVYSKTFNERKSFTEWLIIRYQGGAISPAIVTGNSNTANFRLISERADRGDYELVDMYKELVEKISDNGWERVI